MIIYIIERRFIRYFAYVYGIWNRLENDERNFVLKLQKRIWNILELTQGHEPYCDQHGEPQRPLQQVDHGHEGHDVQYAAVVGEQGDQVV